MHKNEGEHANVWLRRLCVSCFRLKGRYKNLNSSIQPNQQDHKTKSQYITK